MPSLLDDLEAEHAELESIVGSMGVGDWDRQTPAQGWAVRDQVGHLAFFDEAAATAITEPDRFGEEAKELLESAAGGGDPMEDHLRRGRAMASADLHGWWRRARRGLVDAATGMDLHGRVPWYGPSMSPMSFVSARLMETWAHGQDVADALGVERRPTDRLFHVAHIGVRARGFSYALRGLEPPDAAVRVELRAPSGVTWEWDGEPANLVRGPALDFCLVVTQRRNILDTQLVVEGPDAVTWMAIAQAFAGAPGPGRPPLSG